jgi:hypothetical protein
VSALSVAENIYAQHCTRDAGPVEDSRPTCEHVNDCESTESLEMCSCQAFLCDEHNYLCDEGDCRTMICDGCARRSDYDGLFRCVSCASLHNDVMKRRLLVA